mmetsp:Transcript_18326/g.37108  ORF Transcript_18326/g.37108 Transcript_18326/m.37108 type:complete len:245 (+) Transcript_18326:485-1219(+)
MGTLPSLTHLLFRTSKNTKQHTSSRHPVCMAALKPPHSVSIPSFFSPPFCSPFFPLLGQTWMHGFHEGPPIAFPVLSSLFFLPFFKQEFVLHETDASPKKNTLAPSIHPVEDQNWQNLAPSRCTSGGAAPSVWTLRTATCLPVEETDKTCHHRTNHRSQNQPPRAESHAVRFHCSQSSSHCCCLLLSSLPSPGSGPRLLRPSRVAVRSSAHPGWVPPQRVSPGRRGAVRPWHLECASSCLGPMR